MWKLAVLSTLWLSGCFMSGYALEGTGSSADAAAPDAEVALTPDAESPLEDATITMVNPTGQEDAAVPVSSTQDGANTTCTGSDCTVSCIDSQSCAADCEKAGTCTKDCNDSQSCNTTCAAGSSCQVACTNSANCAVACKAGSVCDVTCEAGKTCLLSCEEKAKCRLHCPTENTPEQCSIIGCPVSGMLRTASCGTPGEGLLLCGWTLMNTCQ